MFLNGRQVTARCAIPGCASDKAYADECSLGHQFLPSKLINPVSCLSGKKPSLKEIENWYFDLDNCIDMIKVHKMFGIVVDIVGIIVTIISIIQSSTKKTSDKHQKSNRHSAKD